MGSRGILVVPILPGSLRFAPGFVELDDAVADVAGVGGTLPTDPSNAVVVSDQELFACGKRPSPVRQAPRTLSA